MSEKNFIIKLLNGEVKTYRNFKHFWFGFNNEINCFPLYLIEEKSESDVVFKQIEQSEISYYRRVTTFNKIRTANANN